MYSFSVVEFFYYVIGFYMPVEHGLIISTTLVNWPLHEQQKSHILLCLPQNIIVFLHDINDINTIRNKVRYIFFFSIFSFNIINVLIIMVIYLKKWRPF